MKLFIIELIFSNGKKKQRPCFAEDEMEAKSIVLGEWELRNRQVINKPTITVVRLLKEYSIKRGILRSG